MPSIDILRQSAIVRTARVAQIEGLFDISSAAYSQEQWSFSLPLNERDWSIGFIVGPSGCGKSTLAQELWGERVRRNFDWPNDQSVLDGFPASLGIKDIVRLLSSVGFSSPPLWLRPFNVLSTGQQMRVNLARLLTEYPDLAIMDEFTSVVDRTVAQIGSAAIAKTVRERKQKFVAVTCHYDVLDWLQPDWVFQPHTGEFAWRSLQRRPTIELEIARVHYSAWKLFRSYHYLNHSLNHSAVCFCALWQATPVAFTAALNFPHPKIARCRREHRTVCLPDYQGVGIGNALSNFVASLFTSLSYRYLSQTSHPAMIAARLRSEQWKMIVAPTMLTQRIPANFKHEKRRRAVRLRATFEFVGKSLERQESERLLARPVGNPGHARGRQVTLGNMEC